MALLLLAFLWCLPGPRYQWACLVNKLASYEAFVESFPDSSKAAKAKEKIRLFREDEVWAKAAEARKVKMVRAYMQVYPDGKHLDESQDLLKTLVDEEWQKTASARSEGEVREFLKLYPEASRPTVAKQGILLKELIEEAWQKAAATRLKPAIQEYLTKYPDAPPQTAAAARALIVELADETWKRIAPSRSESEIRDFLKDHPETTQKAAAEARVEELFNDWSWVREQDSLESYKRFLDRFPDHAEREWIERRIIDLEVKQIAEGKYGDLPQAETRMVGGNESKIEVRNDTQYELTVRYSGPLSQKLVIPARETRHANLRPGEYKVAASVAAADVRNYYGTQTMEGGLYNSNFFIHYEYNSSGK